jgi:hypothetical protein
LSLRGVRIHTTVTAGVICEVIVVLIEVNAHKVFSFDKASDRDGSARAGIVRDEMESCKAQLRDRAVEFHKPICTILSPVENDHGSEVVGLRLAAEVGFND